MQHVGEFYQTPLLPAISLQCPDNTNEFAKAINIVTGLQMSQTHAYADILLHTINPDRSTFLLLPVGVTHSVIFFRFTDFFGTLLMTLLVGGDGEGVMGGVNREEGSCSCSAMDSSMSVGMMDFWSGVGGGVSGLTRFDKTGRARFCCGNRSNNSLNAFLYAKCMNGCYPISQYNRRDIPPAVLLQMAFHCSFETDKT